MPPFISFGYSTDDYEPVATRPVRGRCPDCAKADVLEMHYYQKRTEGLRHRVTDTVLAEVVCTHTQTALPVMGWPDRWVEQFEREKSAIPLAPTSTHWPRRAKVAGALLLFTLVAAVGVIALVLAKPDLFEGENAYRRPDLTTAPVGTTYTGMQSENIDWSGGPSYHYAYILRDIRGDSAVLQRSRDTIPGANTFDYDPALADFSGPSITFPRDEIIRYFESERDGKPYRIDYMLLQTLNITDDE